MRDGDCRLRDPRRYPEGRNIEASMFHFWPFWFFWPFHGMLTLVLIVVLLVVLFRHKPAPYAYPAGAAPGTATPPDPSRSEALAILEARYARGEIQRDEYLQKKGDLGG
jgi:putative membrane protein